MAAELRCRPTQLRPGLVRELLERCEAACLSGGDGRGHAATFQRLASERSEPQGLHGQARGGQALQHEDAHAAQGQLDGGQESDRPRPHNHHVDWLLHILRPDMYSVHKLYSVQ